MHPLNLPSYDFRIERSASKLMIFDPIRKKLVTLTPEEWVRQHFLYYMVYELGYPRSRVRVESGTTYNKLSKRSDILFYDHELKPLVLVECKAASVTINQRTFEQVSVYNRTLKAPVIMVTNGLVHYACKVDHQKGSYHFMEAIPAYKDLEVS